MFHPHILLIFIAVFSVIIDSSRCLTFAYSKRSTRSSSMSRRSSSRPQTRARNQSNSGWSQSKYSYRTASSRSGGSTVAKSSSSSSSKSKQGAYCYSLNLENGKKYVGYTKDIGRRLKEHFSGRGAKVTQQVKPLSVNHVQKCTSVENAKKAEKIVYNNMKNYHGIDRVRGAGYTKRFFHGK